ncbi:ATP-binding cassette domain-containing protein [Naumannella halotolerans]|uniref:ATP-binding cassette domain-containing protein n=1 Tax=Naumannella halotolerans TaxID=993414 RepID=UPI00370D2654
MSATVVEPTLELRDVAKSFGPVAALRAGTLVVDPGSIHALVGENGAGKSTLVKIVAGVHRRDSGTFRLRSTDVDFGSTAESKAAGVAVIYQEPTLFPDLSVAENIFMGRHPLGAGRRIDRGAMYSRAQELFDGLGVNLDPRRTAKGLSIADQQIIEIAKAISLDAAEAAALGNALVQARALGVELPDLAAMRDLVARPHPPQRYLPRPDTGIDAAAARLQRQLTPA